MKNHKYFTLSELCNSSTADKLGIDNTPTDPVILSNLDYIMDQLDTIREGYGKPIIINSGYRCPELNKAVGGVADSYHQKGLAVDIRWDDKLIPYIMENAKFDKMIREHSSSGVRWIHIQWHPEDEKDKDLNKVLMLYV